MPIYNAPVDPKYIIVTVNNNNKRLTLSETHIKDSNEPISIYIYEYITHANSSIKVNVKLTNNMTKTYELKHIYESKKTNNHFLALTTLFKHDHYLFPIFYNYYKAQGVQHFYMYYNGIITEEINKLFAKQDVTLVEWRFHYWNPPGIKYPHHAQMGQMHHALYRYGKDNYEYMIFCDLDEYLHIPRNRFIDTETNTNTNANTNTNTTEEPPKTLIYFKNKNNNTKKDATKDASKKTISISNFIKDNSHIDIFGFCNYWSDTTDGNIPTTGKFPNKFLTVETPSEYLERSKNIYKVSSINTIGIHQIGYNFYDDKTAITNLNMYHFYKWSSRNREIENCTYEIDISEL